MVSLTSDQLSSIAGWMSIACWIVVFTPQIWENYQLKSGDGLSVTFIVLWLLGDLFNGFGGVMAHVLPTMVILAVYYSFCDFLLLAQVYYYRYQRRRQDSTEPSQGERSPLLQPVELPPSTQPKPLFSISPWMEYPLLLLFVLGAGVGAWYLADKPDEVSIPEKPGRGGEVELEWRSQLLGWASALLYLGSRIPQISLNFKTRCAGLSLAMFFFSISGNLTYVLSIVLQSMDTRYLLANSSWLAGSGLTIFLDLFVLAQFAVFSYQDRRAARTKVFVDDDGVREDEAA